MNELQKAIITTLKYHHRFEYPLTEQEIWKFLILKNQKLKIKDQNYRVKFKKILSSLVSKEQIFVSDEFYYLKGRGKIVKLRKEREEYSKIKLKIAKRVVRLFSYTPFVKAVAVTGALAMANAKKDDDIDLMIISDKNRLWVTRLILLFLMELLGRRRKYKAINVKDKICLNLWLDELALGLNQNKQNLFTAHEIIQAKPLVNKNEVWERFLKNNLWVEKFMPNGIDSVKISSVKYQVYNKKNSLNILISQFLNIYNLLAFKFQYKIMKSKITNESVGIHSAFFHPDIKKK